MDVKPDRWSVLALYSSYSALMGAAWCPFSTIPGDASDYYDVSEQFINFFELSFMVMYLFTAVPTSYLLHCSLRWSIVGGAAVLAAGAGVRYIAGHSFAWALVGQSIIALGNCLALSSCSTVVDLWFPSHEHVIATAFASLFNGIGVGAQMIMSPSIGNIPVMLGIFTIACAVQLVLIALFFQPDPPHADTSVSKDDVTAYLKNWEEMKFLIFSGSAFGIVGAYLGLIDAFLEPEGYSPLEIGTCGLLLASSGMLGGLCASVVLNRSPNYSVALKVYLWAGLVGSIALCVAVLSYPSLLILTIIYGFGIPGFIPLAVRAAVDETPTIDPSVPTNVLFFSAQVFSLIYSYPALYFQVLTGYTGLYLMALFTLLSVGPFLLLYKGRSASEAEALPLVKDPESNC